VKAVGQRQLADGTGVWPAGANQGNESQVAFNILRVETWVEGSQALPVQGNPRSQKAPGTAKENYPRIDKLLSFNPRHHADDSIIK
jgi:hypothetical protein